MRQRAGKLVQFAVDFDAQRLEDAFRGVAGGTVGLRHDLVHQTIELARRGQRLGFTPAYDFPCDLLGEPLLAVCAEDTHQIGERIFGEHLLCGQGLRHVHTHV